MAQMIQEITGQRTEDLRIVAMGMNYCSSGREMQNWTEKTLVYNRRNFFENESTQSDAFDWLIEAMLEDLEGSCDRAIDILFDHFDTLLSAGKFDEVDALISCIPITDVSLTFSMAVLSITLPATDSLHSRADFFNRVWDRCTSLGEDPHELLGGLREWSRPDGKSARNQ